MNALEEVAARILADKGIEQDGDRPLVWTVSYELYEHFRPQDLGPAEHWKLFGYPVLMDMIGETTILLTETVGYGNVVTNPISTTA